MSNFKLVKTAAALALGASVVTSAVATTDASAASKYKIKSGKLVYAKSGKVVKGYVTYKSTVYKNGSKLTGLKGKTYYKAGKKATGTYKGAYYVKGVKKVTTGTYNKAYYVKGVKKVSTGLYASKYYKDGKLATGTYKGAYYVKGLKKVTTGTYNGAYYVKGKKVVSTGLYADKLYVDGKLNKGYKLYKEDLYKDAVLNKGLVVFEGKLYDGAKLNEGHKIFKDELYNGSELNTKLALFEGKLYDGAKLNEGIKKFEDKWYNNAELADGTFTIDGKEVAIENGVEVGAKVKSVEAINATQLKVTFNRSVKASTVLDSTDTTKLAGSVFKLDGTVLDNTNAAKLVDDKTLVITKTGGITAGAHLFELAAEKVQTKDAKSYVAAYNTNFTVNDTERAAVKEVKYDNAKTIKVYFSEPIKTLGSTTLTYADGTPLTGSGTDYTESFTSGNDYVTYTLNTSSANVKANKDITVAFAGLVDYANNTTKPTTATFKYDNSDVTAPTVSSITATSKTSFDIKFSEGVHSLDVTKLNVNGTDLTVSDKAEVDSNDSTLVHVTLDAANAQTAAVLVKVNAAFAKDFTNNDNTAFTQSVNFKADTTAPTVTGTSVEKINGKNYLIINYNENVTPGTTSVKFNYTDVNGVDQTITETVTPVLYKEVDGKSKSVSVDLSTITGLENNVKYSVDLSKGFVKDLFDNESAAKAGIEVTTGTLTESTTALKITGTPAQKTNTPGVIEIAFDQKVDPTSAKDVANYVVEDATVKSVKLVNNDAGTYKVEVSLVEGTVETTGTYNVTVKNVKPASTSATTIADTTKPVVLDENVVPTIVSAAFTTLTQSSTKVNVVFSEAVDAAAVTTDFDLYVDGVKQSATVTNTTATGEKVVEVTITGYDVQAAVQAGKTVTLKTTDGVAIKDAKKNVTPAATSVTVK